MGFGKDKKGVIFRQEDVVNLGALAASGVIKQAAPPAMTDSFRMIKTEGTASLEFATAVEGDGPLEIYLVSDDLSTTEIVETIGVSTGIPLSRDDIVGGNTALRPVWLLGILPFVPITSGQSTLVMWSKTIRWTFGDSSGFAIVVHNTGSGGLTAGAFVRFRHTAFGLWVGA